VIGAVAVLNKNDACTIFSGTFGIANRLYRQFHDTSFVVELYSIKGVSTEVNPIVKVQ
jgi:hypothetical protein